MQLVKNTGGELIVKYGDVVVETVADYVRIAGVTDLIIGKTWQSVGKKVGVEDKFVARLPELAVITIPDKQKNIARRAECGFFEKVSARKRLQEQFRAANKTLDIINLITRAAKTKDEGADIRKIAGVLGSAFERSCLVITDTRTAVFQWQNEDTVFLMKRMSVPSPRGAKKTECRLESGRTLCAARRRSIFRFQRMIKLSPWSFFLVCIRK